MKYLFLFVSIFLMDSCKSSQQSNGEEIGKALISNCPDDGTCTFEVLKNRNLTLKIDEFGNQYKEVSNGQNLILKFVYKRNEIPNTEDSAYTEEIYIELNPNQIEVELENSELKKANVLFNRLCFCRGQTGTYKIDNGNLSVVKLSNDSYQLNLEFKCEAVPQVIERVKEKFNLN